MVSLLGSDVTTVSPDGRDVRHNDVTADHVSGSVRLLQRALYAADELSTSVHSRSARSDQGQQQHVY